MLLGMYWSIEVINLRKLIFIEIRTATMIRSQSRINHEQQVKVVIRLKPQHPQNKSNKCVYLSEEENHLVVQADLKKQIFVFDHVAHPLASQTDIYHMIGSQAVQTSLQGYNCCIFAYGQTGAGKSYSILGDISELERDPYSPTRGILPRLLEDLFNSTQRENSVYQIKCSYLEIYNEQIYDLLSQDKRVHQIRQDHRRGVFVEGCIEIKLQTYRQAVDLLLQGDRIRKIAATNMNQQSSRSHAIFTVSIESQTKEDGFLKTKKSKLNIVDLAGSERVKYTNVQGERLREASNINKSLHVLGNVINSLVESTRKKKHIPYRDSKLTYYLKDSLGGNSITKLLANVHCCKEYYGDTISTLMFAKRAKILKMKVEVNENFSQNFQTLRKEVRRLRQELAEAKYFRDTQKTERNSFTQELQQTLEKITDNSDYEVPPRLDYLQVFQTNELHYKSLIEIYEEHMKECSKIHTGRRNSINKVGEWKNLEKKNIALSGLVRQFPSFTKIYKENILLKQQRKNEDLSALNQYQKISYQKQPTKRTAEQTSIIAPKQSQIPLDSSKIQEVINMYELMMDDLRKTLNDQLESLQKSYIYLQHQVKIKDNKIRELVKKQDLPPDIEELQNENEYLHLKILNLENEIQQLEQKMNKNNIKEEMKKTSRRRSICDKDEMDEDHQQLLNYVMDQLKEVQKKAQEEAEIADKDRQNFEQIVKQLNTNISSLINENNKLQLKVNRSGSQRRGRDKNPLTSSFMEPEMKRSIICGSDVEPMLQTTTTATNEFRSLQASHTKELMTLRLEIKMKQKQIIDLKEQVQQFQAGDRKIEQQFGKDLNGIIKQYRQHVKRPNTAQVKSMKGISRYKQPQYFNLQLDKMTQSKRTSNEHRSGKGTPRSIKKEDPLLQSNYYTNYYNSKRNLFSHK